MCSIKKVTLFILLTLSISIGAVLMDTNQAEGFDPADFLIYRPLWKVSNLVGNFDPVGKAFDPIEEKISNLTIKGYLRNSTDFNLHGDDRAVGQGRRVKDWDLQLAEWDAELELLYRLNPHLLLGNVYNFQYDAVYDWQNSDGLFANKGIDRDAEYYYQTKRILRELYLDGNYGRFSFRLGKQQVVWGKMDGKIIDIVNPEDARESVQYTLGDYEWRRITTWMANLSYKLRSDTVLNLIWIPDFEPSRQPYFGSAYWPPFYGPFPPFVKIEKRDKPTDWSFKNDEVGLRLDTIQGDLTLSAIYFTSWSDLPTYFTRRIDPRPFAVHVEPKYTRLHQFGLAADYGAYFLGRNWVLRAEGLYTLNKYFATANPREADGAIKKNTLKLGLAFETQFFTGAKKIWLIYQPVWSHTFGYNDEIKSPFNSRNDIIHVFSASHSVRKTDDRLNLSFTLYPWLGSTYGGTTIRLDASWKFSQWLTAKVIYYNFSGNDGDPFGMYDKWDNIGFELKYEF